jgi:hypothetical protein
MLLRLTAPCATGSRFRGNAEAPAVNDDEAPVIA